MREATQKESQFERLLERHINPERSRRFEPERWERSRIFLQELAQEDWLSQKDCLVIHIVGSNGKGSLAWYLSEIFTKILPEEHIGLFSSPHLVRPHERLRFNTKPISDQEALRGLAKIEERIGTKSFLELSYFEILTILMLLESRRRNCRVLVLEAGLGGRLDATRMAAGKIVILTSVAFEHTHLLGSSLSDILLEKLGILTPNARLLCTNHPKNEEFLRAMDFIKKETKITQECRVVHYDNQAKDTYLQENRDWAFFIADEIRREFSSLLPHESLPEPQALRDPPGRIEFRTLPSGKGIIFDTAHNPSALKRSLSDLARLVPLDRYCIVLGLLKDRSLAPCLRTVRSIHRGPLYLVRGPKWAQATEATKYKEIPDTKEGLASVLAANPGQKGLVVIGSHRLYPSFEALFLAEKAACQKDAKCLKNESEKCQKAPLQRKKERKKEREKYTTNHC